jgi:multisubunit Na+/H+ antiporter MnhB subunit
MRRLIGLGATALLAWILLAAVREMPAGAGGLTGAVEAQMHRSGVEHPVTAVLLNFRAYDTWLELGVLLLAVLGVLLFQPSTDLARVRSLPVAEDVLRRAVSLLLPLVVLTAGYLLWIGKYNSGGAFQAGVVLGSGLILLWLSGSPALVRLPGRPFRVLLVLGFAAFWAVGSVLLFTGRELMEYPESQAGNLILFIEACATLSIAWTMAALIVGLQRPLTADPKTIPETVI